MKALFISYNGALEPLIQSQGIPYLKGLSNKGVKCFLLSFEKKIQGLGKLKKELNKHGIKWYHLKYHKRPTLPATMFDIFQGVIFGFFIILREKIDIIHARSTVPAAIGYVLSKISKKKFIFDERGLMAEEYVDGGMWKKNGILYKLTVYFEKKFLREADGVVVLSNDICNFLKDSGYVKWSINKKNRITVIPSCVDLNRFKPVDNKELRKIYNLQNKFIFLYIGSLGTWYMVKEMLDFFLCAKEIIPNAHFCFLVNTGKDLVINVSIEKGVCSDDITITSVDPMQMPEYISIADVGVFFIKPCFSKRSSSPTKFAEYLACGLPVLINKGIGDTAEIVKQNRIGFVVDNFNKEEYMKAVKHILKFQDERGTKERCIETAKNIFSLDTGVSLYLSLYNKVFQKNGI